MQFPDIDILMTSTCRKEIKKTIKSFEKHFHYSGKMRYLVNVDVIEDNRDYLSELENYMNKINAAYFINENPTGLAQAINTIFDKVKSEYFFHLEDDWLFLENVNLDPLISILKNHNEIDHIRFNKEPISKKCWLYHHSLDMGAANCLENQQCKIDGIDLVKTFTWSFNPSINRTATVKTFPQLPVGMHRPETFICKYYEEVYHNKGVYILGKIGSSMICKDIGRPITRRIIGKLRKKIFSHA